MQLSSSWKPKSEAMLPEKLSALAKLQPIFRHVKWVHRDNCNQTLAYWLHMIFSWVLKYEIFDHMTSADVNSKHSYWDLYFVLCSLLRLCFPLFLDVNHKYYNEWLLYVIWTWHDYSFSYNSVAVVDLCKVTVVFWKYACICILNTFLWLLCAHFNSCLWELIHIVNPKKTDVVFLYSEWPPFRLCLGWAGR